MKKNLNIKILPFLILISVTFKGFSQFSVSKKGAIEKGGVVLVDVDKYRNINNFIAVNLSTKDTLVEFTFQSILPNNPFCRLDFKRGNRIVEMRSHEITKSFSLQRDIAKFLVANQLVTDSGSINDSALLQLSKKYSENLTESFTNATKALNEKNATDAAYLKSINPTVDDNGVVRDGKGDVLYYIDITDAEKVGVDVVVYNKDRTKRLGSSIRGISDLTLFMERDRYQKTFNGMFVALLTSHYIKGRGEKFKQVAEFLVIRKY